MAEHVVELQRLEASIARVVQSIEIASTSSVNILTERLASLVEKRNIKNLAIRKATDATILEKATELEDATVKNELALLRSALATADEDNLTRIRQGMHSLLRRVIDCATFDGEASHIHVTIRGGFCIKVPHGRAGLVSAGWTMYLPDARRQDAAMNLPAMEPENVEHPTKLVASKARLRNSKAIT